MKAVNLMTKKKIAFLTLSVALLLTLLTGALFGQTTQKSNVYRYLSIFSEVFDLVKTNYVDQVGPEKLMDGAFSGITDAIDEFSYYVPPAQMAAYRKFVDIEDNGLGVIVTKRFVLCAVSLGFLRTLGARYIPELVRRFNLVQPAVRFAFVQNNSMLSSNVRSPSLIACNLPNMYANWLAYHRCISVRSPRTICAVSSSTLAAIIDDLTVSLWVIM